MPKFLSGLNKRSRHTGRRLCARQRAEKSRLAYLTPPVTNRMLDKFGENRGFAIVTVAHMEMGLWHLIRRRHISKKKILSWLKKHNYILS